jgi:hypothetical protein
MPIFALLIALLLFISFLVGGLFSPMGIIIPVAVAIGFLIVYIAKRRRGAAEL